LRVSFPFLEASLNSTGWPRPEGVVNNITTVGREILTGQEDAMCWIWYHVVVVVFDEWLGATLPHEISLEILERDINVLFSSSS
jgi:hypothetical protein